MAKVLFFGQGMVRSVSYKLKLPQELSRVHNTFHVSNLKKCYADEPLAIQLDGLHIDDKLYFVEEPVEIMDREVERLKQSRISIIKVRWNSRRGPEFTWEREDQFQKKYPHLFTKTAPSSMLIFVCIVLITGFKQSIVQNQGGPKESYSSILKPSLVLDDSCLVNRDLTNCVMGEVLQFSSINNLQVLLSNEGFHNTRVVYLGGLWVMIELKSSKSKSKFMEHVGVASWFRRLCNAQSDFAAKERIVWVDIEGVPLNAWTRSTFQKISSKWGELVELEDGYDDLFARKRICIKTSQTENILESFKLIVKGKVFWARAKELFVWSPSFKDVPEKELFSDDESAKINEQANNLNNDEVENASEVVSDTYFGDNGEVQGFEHQHGESNDKEVSSDPFNIYDLLDKRTKEVRTTDTSTSIPYPPGFTPANDIPACNNQDIPEAESVRPPSRSARSNSRVLEEAENSVDRVSSESFSNGVKIKEGGSILEILEEMITVGQTMGFSMEGLGSKAKKDWIKELISKHKVSFLSIQETKMESVSAMEVKFLWGNYFFDHIISEASGNSGGILCAWDTNFFKKDHHTISDNFIALYGTWIPNNQKLLIISVYAPQSVSSKRMLWSYLESLITSWNGESLIMGDFNEVRCIEERWGSVFNSHGANAFNSFISNSGLNDIQLEGFSFTWAHPSATKMSKLDRFLMSNGLLSAFPLISAICLDRHLSDHRPILLKEVFSDFGPTPFRFYHSWLELPGFDDLVSKSWNSFTLDDSNGMIRFKKKLQMLKKEIRAWTLDFKRHQVGLSKDLKSKLCDIDKVLDQGGVTDDILLSRLEVLKQLHDVQSSNNRDIMQKAKIRWAIEGDENSKYFHAIINKKCANISVKGIMVDGDWIVEPDLVKQEFRRHFTDRFQDPGSRRGSLNFPFPNRLNNDQILELESPISNEDIRTAVWGCGVDKSPGPDGFTFEFIHFVIGCNSSFVALIPKVLDPKVVSDYRPISLIGSLYKGNFLGYLDDVLISFGFGPKWRSWIRGSLSSGKASILVNGSPTTEFHLYRGLKQGDPLAPFLFLLIMESLHLSFSRAVEAGIFKGYKINPIYYVVYLFYATTRYLLKSHLLGVGIPENCMAEAAKSIGCLIMKAPFKCLGILVGDNMSSKKAWDETINKMKKRLSRWKLNTLSIGGRLTLLKSEFFNGFQEGDRKIAWVKWSKVLASKKFRGLGVSSFFALNRALLFKWVWRYLSHDNSLWSRIISALHGLNGHVLSAAFNSTWSSIITEVNSLKVKGVDLISHCKIRVGKGTGTSFWKDLWIGDNLLKLSFPRLFALEENKDISVADKMNTSISSSFRRHVRGGVESQQLDQLSLLLDTVILSNMDDRWFWDLNGDGVFQVKDVRSMLDEAFLPKMEVPTRWIKSIPIKVNVFAWKLYLDRLPTRSNLSRRNVSLPSLACPLCDHVLEDSSHLFFGCSVAKDIQKLICRWWNLDVHPYESYEDWLSWFKSIRLGSKAKEVLEGVFYVSWWSLWNFRDQFLFASPIPRKDAIFDNIVLRSFYWCVARCNRTLNWVVVSPWSQHERYGAGDLCRNALADWDKARDKLKEWSCLEGRINISHYYPQCPQPELTLGLTSHTDPCVLTVLVQNEIGGLLQVKCGEQWVEVEPVPGAIVVNIGDLLQMMSNDIYKSVEHRVLANNVEGARVSVAHLFNPSNREKLFGPFPELISAEKPAVKHGEDRDWATVLGSSPRLFINIAVLLSVASAQ
ncbi:RNA-directed DNA polymerase, eukaryota [Tanacetum coccineum]